MTTTFVITLEMDAASFRWLNELRRKHFPSDRNFLDAHLTLFHKLDAHGVALVQSELTGWRGGGVHLDFLKVRSLGRGVAIEIASPNLVRLRTKLTAAVASQLTPQDAQPFRPHVTLHNKVEPAVAKATFAHLAQSFQPRIGAGIAIQVWRYLGGPWELSSSTRLLTN